MPELPEVETVRRGLEPAMAGARIVAVEARRPDLRFPLPPRFADRLAGQTIVALGRRAKYLLADFVLRRGPGDASRHDRPLPRHRAGWPGRGTRRVLRRGCRRSDAPRPATHDHVVFRLSNGFTVTYNDARRFGFMDLVARRDLETSRHFAGWASSPLAMRSTARWSPNSSPARARRSRPLCSTRG